MYYMRLLIGFIVVLSCGQLSAQDDVMAAQEDELVFLLDQLRSSKDDAEKKSNNDKFKAEFAKALESKSALTHQFTKLNTVGFIDSPDKLVRIINWNVEQDDKTQRYYGYVLHYDKRKKKYYVTELIQDLYGMNQPKEVVTSYKWYGALYYKIIPVKRGSKTVYTVLGWDGNTTMSNIKLLDVMYLTGKTVKFGLPIFKTGKTIHRRMFYEHAEKVTMNLNYEEERKRIMMDHLSPESPTMKGYYSFYVPDLSYDAFKLEKGKWILHEDVIGINRPLENDEQVVYVKDPRTGKLKKQVIDIDWQNPEDANAPAGGNEHVAVTPEGEAKEDKKESRKDRKKKEKSDPNVPAYDKKDKRDPNNISFYDDMKKSKRKKRKEARQRRKAGRRG